MIDIIHAKSEFKKYVSNYDIENPKIVAKISHIERVASYAKKIAESLKLPEEEVKLAELIGIFHDLGRFEQVRIANTFNDKESGINHGEFSVKVLFEENLIKNFIEDDKYDYIIKTAVLNHNKGKIDEGLSEKKMLFSKIIRDADKLDIINNILLIEDFKIVFWFDNFDISEISEYAMKTMENRTLLNYEYVKNNADQIVVFYAYIFDLYFDISLKIVAKEKSLEKYTEIIKKKFTSLQVHKQSDRILEICYKYFKDKKVI